MTARWTPPAGDSVPATPSRQWIFDGRRAHPGFDRERLAGARADVSGADGVHFEAVVVAEQFAGSCRWPAIGWSTPRSAT
jgi:hypothetical protein